MGHNVITFHYTLKNDAGEVLDSSVGAEPLAMLEGHQNIIPGLEAVLVQKTVGDQFDVSIAPEEGYGVVREELRQQIAKSQFEDPSTIQVGAQFQVEMDGHFQIATVTAVDGDEVTIDFNHPLAGETLHFSCEVVDIREATSEELDHGHVHGAGGHHHH